MDKEKFVVANEMKPSKSVDKTPEDVEKNKAGKEGAEMSETDQELAEINKALAFGKQTEAFLKKHPGILSKAGEIAENVLPTNTVRKIWDKFPKEAQMALIYADLGTNANIVTSPIAVPLRFLRKLGMLDYKGDENESEVDKKTSIQKGIEWLAKHYPETAAIATPLIELKDSFAELGKDVRQGVKEARRKDREKRASEALASDKKKIGEVKERIQRI
ncbi:MAG: hypothetical protein WC551_05170 [Patescibacteria group bacterium]